MLVSADVSVKALPAMAVRAGAGVSLPLWEGAVGRGRGAGSFDVTRNSSPTPPTRGGENPVLSSVGLDDGAMSGAAGFFIPTR